MGMVRLLEMVPWLHNIFILCKTVYSALPSILYMAVLSGLFLFVFSVLAMHVFGNIRWGEDLNEKRNFSRVPIGMMTLFGIATGDGVKSLIAGCSIQPPYCSEAEGDCG